MGRVQENAVCSAASRDVSLVCATQRLAFKLAFLTSSQPWTHDDSDRESMIVASCDYYAASIVCLIGSSESSYIN
jgi:hypothetical protein